MISGLEHCEEAALQMEAWHGLNPVATVNTQRRLSRLQGIAPSALRPSTRPCRFSAPSVLHAPKSGLPAGHRAPHSVT